MGLARSRAVEQSQAAVLCRDAVTIMVAQSSALDSGSIAAAAEANKRLKRDPTEQAILATIQGLRSKGHSLRSIASTLNRQGYRTRRGSQWRLESVAQGIR